ncbi:TlpA family protein disulfide reductase [Algoriphagus resistens]|uniref:TlpA family protein disulfide reductase n=1 Tax=Algoriphagus resistens TaxID=1750590 RepID=UPI000716848E|nr:TlpA disulfide reductase family protein [Algoriphagus resistens]
MKKLILICLLGYLCLPTSTLPAQVADSPGADFLHRSRPTVSPEHGDSHRGGETRPDTLSIGDQIPSGIEFSEVLHYNSDKLRLDDYQGKYVILEFWAPTCTASIASLPQLDAIQRKYGDRIAILPISVFAEDKIAETISGNERLEAVELPLIVNAGKMRSYFPHKVIPHLVVLDPKGSVIAITGIEDLTEANLEKLLSTAISPFRYKEDVQIQLPIKAKLLTETPQLPNKNIWFESAMTGYIPGVTGSLIQQFGAMSHIRIVNMSLLYHYQLAFSGRDLVDYFGRNRMDTEGFDTEELWSNKMGMDYDDWMAEGTHVFGYELIAPSYMDPYRLMREDLKRYFPHIEAGIEDRSKTVYALVQQEGKSYPPSTGNPKSYSTSQGVKMVNYPLQGFVYHLNSLFYANSPYPIVNLTGIDYPIDLSLDTRIGDYDQLKQALRAKGLDLVKREETLPVLVLKKVGEPKLLRP